MNTLDASYVAEQLSTTNALFLSDLKREDSINQQVLSTKTAKAKDKAKEEEAAKSGSAQAGSSGSNPITNTGIFLIMMFMVDQMNMNSMEQVAGTQHMQVVSNNLAQIGQNLDNLNPELTSGTHAGTLTWIVGALSFLGGWAGFGLFMGFKGDIEKFLGDTGPSQGELASLTGQQQEYGLLGSINNQQESEDMQINVTQTSQNNSAFGSMYSQMLSVWNQMANISNSRA